MDAQTVDKQAFRDQLTADGFSEIEEKFVAPGRTSEDDHTHGYDVRALVLEGRIAILEGGETRQDCGPGQVFTMTAGREHLEEIGKDGVRFLVGRRHAG